jgi:hypothetical protein
MPEDKHQLKKLSNKEVDGLKGKLVEVRRIGTNPIFIEVTKTDTIKRTLEKADIPGMENELKVEAVKTGTATWKVVKMSEKAYLFSKIAVTTKVSGA